MLLPMRDLTVQIIDGLSSVEEKDWNRLAHPDDPFTDIRFLRALENSLSVGAETGWSPCHVLVSEEDTLIAAMPFYAKDHSYGEYIFDWAWANSSHRAGIPYYPKLVSAVPFTPATGSRILHGKEPLDAEVMQALKAGWTRIAQDLGIMSIHVLFTREEQNEQLIDEWDFMKRLTYQFHWENQGWSSFDEFLGSLRSPSRKQIRKERKTANSEAITIITKRGNELTDDEWEQLYPLYRSTTDAKGAIPYLEPAFFREIKKHYADNLVVVLANDEAQTVAGSISFQKGKHLYGRYWGCLERYDNLHFEMCYYRLIELAIQEGYTRFEAGAQGTHKLKRGLLPSPTYSAHWIRHKGLSDAIAGFLDEEARGVEAEMAYFAKRTPFKRGD